jgi:hypothetical protein
VTNFEVDEMKETTLGSLGNIGSTRGDPIPVLIGHNLGHRTLNMTMPIQKFWEISEVANELRITEMGQDSSEVAQRPLDKQHATDIALYLLKGLVTWARQKLEADGEEITEEHMDIITDLGEQPYQAVQAITTNIRNCERGGTDLRVLPSKDGATTIVYLTNGQILWVVDGQHRREAMNMMFGFLKAVLTTGKYPKKGLFQPTSENSTVSANELRIWALALEGAKSACTVDVTVHLGLKALQEKQLFHDLNNLTKKVEKSIANAFDASNPVNSFVRQVLEAEGLIKAPIAEKDDIHLWDRDNGSISRKDVVMACSLLFAGQTDTKKVQPGSVNHRHDLGRRFWRAISNVPHFGTPGSNKKTVLAQTVVIKALAQLVHTFAASREADSQNLERLLHALDTNKIDFSHQNPMWHIFEVPVEQREALCPGITDAITPPAAALNLTVGNWNEANQIIRFGANSRDIQRHLGDVIRWSLGLPKRPALVALQKKVAAETATVNTVAAQTPDDAE